MAQLGFFDADKRLAALSAKGDPLEAIEGLVPWESFRAEIEAVVLTPEAARKSTAGRKPIDAIVMLRMLVLQSLYNLSDAQAEYQVRDRLSFTRFLGLGFADRIPDGTCGCSARSSLVPDWSRSCSSVSASTSKPKASRAAGR
jgi:hypothetical protein